MLDLGLMVGQLMASQEPAVARCRVGGTHPGPFTLKSVEQTLMCYSHRGVSEEGLCN